MLEANDKVNGTAQILHPNPSQNPELILAQTAYCSKKITSLVQTAENYLAVR